MNESSKIEKYSFRIRHFLIIILVALACIPLGYILYFGVAIYEGSSHVLHEADGGFKKAKSSVNPEQLRAWALSEISRHSETNTDGSGHDISSEIPDYMQRLYPDLPEDATVYPDHDQPYVDICWGGGFFHWTIDIGSTNFTETTGATNEYTTAEWVPGIYYSREDTAHPIQ